MKSILLSFLLCNTVAAMAFDHSHKMWDQVLHQYLDKDAFVKYKKLKSDSSVPTNIFNQYLKQLSSVSQKEYDTWAKPEQMSFLINSYNAFTIKLIIDNYPVGSIKDLGGIFTKPWDIKFFKFLGKDMSLDPIEHELLRPVFKDYRIHAAVNCASYSCPVLATKAFTPSNLDQLLDAQMTLWINDPARNKINESGQWQLSKIFDWYKDDFVKWGGGVEAVVKKYHKKLKDNPVKKIDISYLKYDWSLNVTADKAS